MSRASVFRWGPFDVAVILLTAAVLVALSSWVLLAFPHAADEYDYVYQARTFLAGRLFNPPAPDPVAMGPMHVVSTGEAMFSKYPPGWPLILALGEAIGAAYLVNPLIGVITLVLVASLARRVAGQKVGRVALLLLATNGFFLLNAASFFSHPLAGLAVVILLHIQWSYLQEPRAPLAAGAGACLLVVVLSRPQDAVVLVPALFPFAAFLAARWKGKFFRDLGWVVGIGAIAVLLHLAYNKGTTGDPLLFGHQVYDPRDRFTWNALALAHAFANRFVETLTVAWGTVPAFFMLVVLAHRRRLSDQDLFLACTVIFAVLFWAGYAAYSGTDFPPRIGPRYLYPSLIVLFVPAAAALVRMLRPGSLIPVVVAVCAAQLYLTARMVETSYYTIRAGQGIYRASEALKSAIHPEKALVIVAGRSGGVPENDLLRNDLDYTNPVLFTLHGFSPMRFPGRLIYVWDGIGGVPCLWSTDTEASVHAVYATEPVPTVIRRSRDAGWLVSAVSNACKDRLFAIPGEQDRSWSDYGPCPGETHVDTLAWPDRLPNGFAGKHRFAVHYRSFLWVEKPGFYHFSVTSDDGAVLRVDEAKIIEIPGTFTARVRNGDAYLGVGPHPVSVSYFNHWGDAVIALEVTGPDGRAVSHDRFRIDVFHERPGLPLPEMREP